MNTQSTSQETQNTETQTARPPVAEPLFDREVAYNFTSASDKQIVEFILGEEGWRCLEELYSQRITGRSARLVMRIIGDLFILRRNPFLFQELLDSRLRRHTFFETAKADLNLIEKWTTNYKNGANRGQQVFELLAICRQRLKEMRQELKKTPELRSKINRRFGAVIGRENVRFDPFTLISHVTDATDWRLYLPLAVLRPSSEEQVPPLMAAAARLGLGVIPRGGGTGLTGGAVPLTQNCVIINTEKLTRIYPIIQTPFPHLGEDATVSTIKLEAGVVTSKAMAEATKAGLVFAADPTSSWACTIGGNVAENSGGKTAVLWGTAIDNALAWTIAMPGTGLLRIARKNHPMRKIQYEDTLEYEVRDAEGTLLKEISLKGSQIRKKGLGKDITNKALGGLPGFQKEGCDGVITSAEFVLYPAWEQKITFCLEFYGKDMDEASRVIVQISDEFKNSTEEALIALEHFDAEYIKAINYKYKSARSERPKAVLLIDLVGHDTAQAKHGRDRLKKLLDPYPNTEVFIAQDADESERFWRDRKRLGAISKRTNAFKLNEDIVLPLPALAEFTRFIDSTNIREDYWNKKQAILSIMEYLHTAEPLEDPDWLEAKIPAAEKLCQAAIDALEVPESCLLQPQTPIKDLMSALMELFQGYTRVSAGINAVYDTVREKRIVIATHMHAGDGNNHVNIPVFSNDRNMMHRASATAEKIMLKSIALGGAVSGEHGIGVTKMKFLEPERIKALNEYRNEVDPDGMMNPGMLRNEAILNKVFTNSFNLLKLEARILQHSSLAELSTAIAGCIRCGKCMPDCCVYHPESNLFFHPRNKNLVIGSLIEALLYDIQRSHLPKFRQLANLEEVADHCTMCGKCLPPCPVDIDTARVSILEREILAEMGYKHTPIQTKLSLNFLKTRNRTANSIFRKSVLQLGSATQQAAVKVFAKAPESLRKKQWKPLQLLNAPMTSPTPHTLSSVLPACSDHEMLLLTPEGRTKSTVFYFPGCGSERLFSDIGKASIYLLLKHGVRVVLPPPNLCCGFPLQVNAKKKMAEEVALRNSIILTQIRDMLGHIEFASVLVSCGTCREALNELGIQSIFECALADISAYVLENGWNFTDKEQRTILYHTPCHDSFKGEAMPFLKRIYNDVQPVANCCSEAGTLALSRPDIASAMRLRKREQFEIELEKLEETGQREEVMIVATNCPSCITGLGRNRDVGVNPQHIAVLLAEKIGGENWREEMKKMAATGECVIF
ncbi:DUF3683 domain-containing protein [Desulforhopalus vacuolatus]|uniref:DUF3683 domain-containing protein n=1 Tax=Desulforhopalus vacuolatus TaxID=40414 RepID=UPI001962AA0D|nr:DUF3683 domain-containing protein [Desulforhopalus vacuolatus]MBM9519072.1 DUF3683 domain-containing protein [Desulforhopalus vacuolatus]